MAQTQSFIPFLVIFGIQLGIIVLIITLNFRRVAGKSLKSMTGPDGQAYFFSKRKYGRYGSKYALSVGTAVHNGFVFSIWRKTFWHRFLESLGLAQGVRSEDPSFDAAYYCMADDEQRLKALLGTSFVNVVRETFETSQAQDIECAGGKIWFNTKPVNLITGINTRMETLISSQHFTSALEAKVGVEHAQEIKAKLAERINNPAAMRTMLSSEHFTSALEAKVGAEHAQEIKAKLVESLNDGRTDHALKFKIRLGEGSHTDELTFVSQVAKLAQEVEKLDAPSYSQYYAAGFPPSRKALLYRIIHVVLFFGGAVALASLAARSEDLINMREFFLKVAGIAPLVMLVWLGMLIAVFGRTSWFPQICSSFLLSGVAGLALLTAFAVREVNIDLDQAPPEVKSLQVQSKRCSLYCTTGGKHASTQTYYLSDQQCSVEEAVATRASYQARDYKCRHSAHFNYNLYFPWPTQRTDGKKEMYKVAMRAESYQRSQVGQPYSFPLHKGYLGLAWIRKSEIRPE